MRHKLQRPSLVNIPRTFDTEFTTRKMRSMHQARASTTVVIADKHSPKQTKQEKPKVLMKKYMRKAQLPSAPTYFELNLNLLHWMSLFVFANQHGIPPRIGRLPA